MSKQLQQTINFAQKLSSSEQIELIKTLFQNLIAQPLEKLNLVDIILQLLREAFYASEWPPSELELHTPNSVTQKTFQDSDLGQNIVQCENAQEMFDRLAI